MSHSASQLEISFRKASIQDASAIANLVNTAYRGDASRLGWTTEAELLSGQRTDPLVIEDTILSPHQWIYLCIDKTRNEIIGSVQLEKLKPSSCYFGMFAIQPTRQAKGIGKAFLEAAEKFAREELGCSSMEMTVINCRQELIAWYERRGYQNTNEIRAFPYGDERFGIPLRPDLALCVFRKRL